MNRHEDATNNPTESLTPIGGRKKARRFAMQALYSWHIANNELKDIATHILVEHAEEQFDREYFQQVLYEVPKHLSEIADALNMHLARPMNELDPIELSVLRVAVFELMYRFDIPYKVVINEALDLVKVYGASESHKFVNGVLDKVARDVRKAEIR